MWGCNHERKRHVSGYADRVCDWRRHDLHSVVGAVSSLSVIIPARNERWLSRTVEDVVAHAKGDTTVIVVLDGAWPEPGYELVQHSNVQVLYLPRSVGQRAATNLAAKIATSDYVMKLDAHCAVADGFDVELMKTAEQFGPDVTQIPAQHNLHVFDWVCQACGRREYQGPTPTACRACDSTDVKMEIVWNPIRRRTEYWRFDSDLKFQYWGDYKTRPEAQSDVVDVMTSLGACFFMTRKRFWELGGLDENHGSWGQFGVEIACKSWLSGGRHVVNKRTWFSHLFRTQGGDFSFPYPVSGNEHEAARQYSRRLWLNDGWEGQKRPLRWLLEKFAPVPGWTEEQIDALPRSPNRTLHIRDDVPGPRVGAVSRAASVTKGVVYYTDNECPEPIASAVQIQLDKVRPGSLVSVSLRVMPFGINHVLSYRERGILTMFKQILLGLETLTTDYVFLCEHDVLYPKEHFDFVPPRDDTYYYNQNVWKVDAKSGRALHYLCSQTSGLCANRWLLVEHYRKRVALVEHRGFTRGMGFEPGTHGRKERVDDFKSDVWFSAVPLVDIRHSNNLTPSRWRREQFRNQRFTEGWTESDSVPGWGKTLGRFDDFLSEVTRARVEAVA